MDGKNTGMIKTVPTFGNNGATFITRFHINIVLKTFDKISKYAMNQKMRRKLPCRITSLIYKRYDDFT